MGRAVSSVFVLAMSTAPAHSDPRATFGGLVIGTIVSTLLFGGLCVQVYSYALKNRDGKGLKSLVSQENASGGRLSYRLHRYLLSGSSFAPFYPPGLKRLRLLEAAHTALLSHGIYQIAVVNFGDFQVLSAFPNSLRICIFLTVLVGSPVQVSDSLDTSILLLTLTGILPLSNLHLIGQKKIHPAHLLHCYYCTGSFDFLHWDSLTPRGGHQGRHHTFPFCCH